MSDLPDYALDPPEETIPVAFTCAWCGDEILDGDTFFAINEERVCENCIDDCRQFAEAEDVDADPVEDDE